MFQSSIASSRRPQQSKAIRGAFLLRKLVAMSLPPPVRVIFDGISVQCAVGNGKKTTKIEAIEAQSRVGQSGESVCRQKSRAIRDEFSLRKFAAFSSPQPVCFLNVIDR